MNTIKLKNFNILVHDDKNGLIAVQSGKPLGSTLDEDLIRVFENKLDSFLSNFNELINIKPDSKLLDIGSGNSLFDIALAKHYPDLSFVLVDGDIFDPKTNPDLVHDSDYRPYNQWAPVFENIKLNDLDPLRFQTVDYTSDYWGEPNSFDVIMSTSSWGWHYPIETYLEKVYSLLKPGGYLIIRPLLKKNNYLETVNSVLGSPLFLKEFTFDQIQGNVKPREEKHWVDLVGPTGPDHVMFYHVIWKKP